MLVTRFLHCTPDMIYKFVVKNTDRCKQNERFFCRKKKRSCIFYALLWTDLYANSRRFDLRSDIIMHAL